MKVVLVVALLLIPSFTAADEEYCYVDSKGNTSCITIGSDGSVGGGGCGGSFQCGANEKPLGWIPDYIDSTSAPLINQRELLDQVERSKMLQLEKLKEPKVLDQDAP
ncbi:hypothetical protein [Marinobacter sp.]|uniref:hypothetical protein n=1 Tax=Marinobacter sp. TaxID=50741 RepID=UPI0023532DA3|nr:hypothetical protein [Marinobacter sp.]